VRNANYQRVHEVIRPTVFVPNESEESATFQVRTAGDPLSLSATLRRAVEQARPGIRIANVYTQSSVIRRQIVRERLLAVLSLFFAIVALVLGGVGLFGVLNYSVIQQRREIGIRMALGARSGHVVRRVTAQIFAMVCLGLGIGIAGGLASERFVATLLFGVKATDAAILAAPILTLLGSAILAALPPAIRAVRIDPAETLRET
jgi:putative ABC transport system permease protein